MPPRVGNASARAGPLRSSAKEPRWIVGIQSATDGRELTGVLLEVQGHGLALQARLLCQLTRIAPTDLAQLCSQLSPAKSAPAEFLLELSNKLADLAAEVVAVLVPKAPDLTAVHTIGILDQGHWHFADEQPVAYRPLVDPLRLAELTGLNVIANFPARDILRNGLGGPLTALPYWLLLRDARKTRLLVDLDQTLRITYLPRYHHPHAHGEITAFEVGPGLALLAAVAEHFSLEPGTEAAAHVALQGEILPELLAELNAIAHELPAPPHWHPGGIECAPYLAMVHAWLAQQPADVADVLCTVNQFLVALVQQAVERHLPVKPALDELLICGRGQENSGLLLQLAAQFAPAQLRRMNDLTIPTPALEASAVAVLAALCLDQTPANLPAATGTEIARVLGQVTPGAPQNWLRLLREAGASAGQASLRSAI